MIPVKIQCVCGQKYSFEVEPVNGRMPITVACPLCGVDGTAAANEALARSLPPPPAPAVTPPPIPPPVPPALPRGMPPRPPAATSIRSAVRTAQPPKRKDDGWGSPETDLNKLGLYVVMIPSIVAALISWNMFGVHVPMTILAGIVAVCGVVGGILNLLGRGPILAGALIGLVIGLGGYGATYGWIYNREEAYKFELIIAFAVGALPGLGLQYLFQRIFRKRALA